MTLLLVTVMLQLVTGYSSTKNLYKVENNRLIKSNDIVCMQGPTKKNSFNNKAITITVSYAAIECGCPQWFETKFKNVKFLEKVERFYLEPINKNLINANKLWDGKNLLLTVKITGRFSKEKEIPITYHTKGMPEKGRIFWYDKIVVISTN